jgi:hypothetical protein
MAKLLLVLLATLFASLSAVAGQNPDLSVFLDADDNTANAVDNRVDPAVATVFDVYVCFDRFGHNGGLVGVTLRLERTFGGFLLGATNLLEGLVLGDFDDIEADGWVIATPGDCAYPDEAGVVVALELQYLYLGPTGSLQVQPHVNEGAVAVDCDFDEDTWSVATLASHGFYGTMGVNQDAPEPPPPPPEDYVTLEVPENGVSYWPCAPDTIVWDTNVFDDLGSRSRLDLYWRVCDGVWSFLASYESGDVHPWTSAPCDTGCYQVKIESARDRRVSDSATFYVRQPQYYLEITEPEDGGSYAPCAPDMVWWDSDIPAWPGSPDVLDLWWRPCGGTWSHFATDNNDSAHPWSEAPCIPGCYQVKIEYRLHHSTRDTVTFDVVTTPVEPSSWGTIKARYR